MLLRKLRERCEVFLRRRGQPTSTEAAQQASCQRPRLDRDREACALVCLMSTGFFVGLFAVVATTYAAHMPYWISVEVPVCDIVHAASPTQTADVRGSSGVRVSDVAVSGKTSSNISGSTVKGGRGCSPTAAYVFVSLETVCAVYGTKRYSCGKTVTSALKSTL